MANEKKEETKEKKKTKEELLEEADKVAERLEKANQEKAELLEREIEMEKIKALSGTAEAGLVKPKPKEDTPEEYADKVLKGEANPLKEDGFV